MNDTGPPSFLGRGWGFPVAVSNDIAMVEGDEDVRQAMLLILETAKGERVLRPDFGCGLRRLAFASMSTALTTLARQEVEDALVTWEPRIELHGVTVTEDPRARGTLLIDIRYRVRATNTFYNLVYPFYLRERRP